MTQLSDRATKKALLVIDMQVGFDLPYWGKRNNPQCEANVAKLIAAFRLAKRPVLHVQHMSDEANSPLRPGQGGNDFKAEAAPAEGEVIFQKAVNSAFIGTKLEEFLREQKIESLVICGLTTDHCVSTTTRMAGNLGFDAVLVSDAVATFNRKGVDGRQWSAEDIHQSALASLNGEFARVLNLTETLAELSLTG